MDEFDYTTSIIDGITNHKSELKVLRSDLRCEVIKTKQELKRISAKKEIVNVEINRAQKELSDLETLENTVKDKLFQFRKEKTM